MKRTLWLLLSGLALLTCQKREELPSREYPRLLTLPATDAREADGITLRAELLTTGASPVVEYGFVWSNTQDEPVLTGRFERISIGKTTAIGPFEARVDFGHTKGVTHNVRAYVRTAQYTVYGDTRQFMSQGCSPPIVKSFAPRMASWGDTVVIQGERFSALRDQVKVYFGATNFGNVEATVLSMSGQHVVCLVPSGLSQTYPKVKIRVVAYGQSGTSLDDFTLDQSKPVITSFSPETGTFGDRITLKGTGFSIIPNRHQVFIGNEQTPVVSATKTQLIVEVPASLTRQTNQIAVGFGDYSSSGGLSVAPSFFVMRGPKISTLAPSGTGQELTITGENFNPDAPKNLILVGPGEAVAARNGSTKHLNVALGDLVFPQPTTNFNVSVKATEQTSEEKPITLTYRNQWVKRANERTPIFRSDYSYNDRPLTGFTLNGKAYMLQGATDNYGKLRLYEYNPAAFSWRKLATTPLTASNDSRAAAFVNNGAVYVLVGSFARAFWEYDVSTDRWKQLPNPPVCLTDRYFRGFTLNGKFYVVHERGKCSGIECWEYDPSTQQWLEKKGGPNSSSVLDAYVVKNRAFVLVRGDAYASYRLVEYLPATDSWVEKGGLDNPGGDSMLGLGVNDQFVLTNGDRSYRYNLDQNRWTIQNSALNGTFYGVNGVGLSVGNQGFLFLKQSLNGSNLHFWEFDPSF